MPPDPKYPQRVRDPELLRRLHIAWRGSCALDELGDCDETRYSLHHILNKPRDDVEANLAMVCGHGTSGHHGKLESRDRETCQHFAVYLMRRRLDTMAYLGEKLGGVNGVREWLRNRLYCPI